MDRVVLLAAGGTAGHLFPAAAVAEVLTSRGWQVHLATDHRAETYGSDFPAVATHLISSATISRSLTGLIRAVWKLGAGFVQSWRLVGRLRPAVAVGFGGYPTLPPILVATRRGVPTIVHDQNAVLGRANRFLAGRVDYLATSVAEVARADGIAASVVETGNPVRPLVREAAKIPYSERSVEEPFRLLVFGGSQGASFLSDLIPAALAELPEAKRSLLRIVQQCRPGDLGAVTAAYEKLGIRADLHGFFADLPRRMAASHLVISRSGASTCAELTVIGRPAIMIPLPGALDHDQRENARLIDAAGGGWMVAQADLTPERLGGMLARFIDDPDGLREAARRAGTMGRHDGAERLADLVEQAAVKGNRSEETGKTP